MKTFSKKYLLVILGVAMGIMGGYFYWAKVGCSTGSCPLTSSPLITMGCGALMGGLLFSSFKKKNNNNN